MVPGVSRVIRAEDVPGLSDLDADAPVYMVNLLKFKEPDGLASYRKYGAGTAPLLKAIGASVCFSGTKEATVIAGGEPPWWDAILVVKYPTPAAFLEMVTGESYAQVAGYREDALERGALIATAAWDLR